VHLACEIDWDYDLLENQEGSKLDGNASGPPQRYKGNIGYGLEGNSSGMAMLMTSVNLYAAWCGETAATANVSTLELLSATDWLQTSPDASIHWAAVFQAARSAYQRLGGGAEQLTLTTGFTSSVLHQVPGLAWTKPSLDVIGVVADWSLETGPGDAGMVQNTSVEAFRSVWELSAVPAMQAVAGETSKPVLIVEAGYQSRIGCGIRPNGTYSPTMQDCASWQTCFDMTCQAHAFEAVMRSVHAHSTVYKLPPSVHGIAPEPPPSVHGTAPEQPPSVRGTAPEQPPSVHGTAPELPPWARAAEAVGSSPWLLGVIWNGWRSDPTSGGPGDFTFTPHGKPAEVVLRRWFGNYTCPPAQPCAEASVNHLAGSTGWTRRMAGPPSSAVMCGYGTDYLQPATHGSTSEGSRYDSPSEGSRYDSPSEGQGFVRMLADGSDMACDGSDAVSSAVLARTPQTAANNDTPKAPSQQQGDVIAPSSGVFAGQHGWNFGIGQWSYPGHGTASAVTMESLRRSLAVPGANAVQIPLMWWMNSENDTTIYPETDPDSPLFTSTDADYIALLKHAKSLGATVTATVMLDFNRFASLCWKHPGCPWRGEIGQNFPGNCSEGSVWSEWWSFYGPMALHYASIAEAGGADAYLVHHELLAAAQSCPERWESLIDGVRGVFSGRVAMAANLPSASAAIRAAEPWARKLDYVGFDTYFQYSGTWAKSLAGTYGPMVYQDANQSALQAAFAPGVESLVGYYEWLNANASANGTKIPLVATEVGFGSRPHGFLGNEYVTGGRNCLRWEACVWEESLARSYQAYCDSMTSALGPDQLQGVLWWLWHSDPTAGGTSDSTKCSAGKPVAMAKIVQCFGAA
jgi:hypothetical protein